MSNKENKLSKELLSFLASTYALYLKTQNFHWNVTGPHFISLHGFLDAQYKELAEAIDTIAEQIRALNSFVPANFTTFEGSSHIHDATKILDAKDMIKTLLADHQTLRLDMKRLLKVCEDADDLATQDLIIERLRSHEKTIWMLRSLATPQ